MSKLLNLLAGAVDARSRQRDVALLLSGGIDSISVGLSLDRVGKRVHAYTLCVEGLPSGDVKKARKIAGRFAWRMSLIEVPTSDLACSSFARLAVEHGCKTKTQFEVTYPFLYLFPQIDEFEIWTGFNADDHYLNTREYAFEQRRMKLRGASAIDRKRAFDAARRAKFEAISDPSSGDTWGFVKRVAEQHGKTLLDPYLDEGVRHYFEQFNYDQLSPLSKPIVREALSQHLKKLPHGTIATGVQLQTGAGVGTLFETLLADDKINRFPECYDAVSPLCQRWAREVAEHPEQFAAELRSLPPPVPAIRVNLISRPFGPYLMQDVRIASANNIAVAVEAFAGGGGSAVGLHLAGYRVAVANEFVLEAARTYRENFPETAMDLRDVRDVIG